MEIHWFDSLPSTQLYLAEALKNGTLKAPVAVATADQPDGIGSRHNKWQNRPGNLFFSFALMRSALPTDLPLQSLSLYAGLLFCEVLRARSSQVWLKWPNDLYLESQKIGGVMTQLKGDCAICGIGLNLLKPQQPFGSLDIQTNTEILLADYLGKFSDPPLWKSIFSRFEIEFERSRECHVHVGGKPLLLRDAVLNKDGSVTIESRRVFSER